MLRRNAGLLLLALSLAACGGGNDTTDAGPADGAVPTDAQGGGDGGPDGGPGDNGSFDTATPIEIDAAAATAEAIAPARDVDYFSFEGTAGQWVAIFTTTPDPAMPDDPHADTVITLYGPDRMQLAENDDAQPRAGTDSEIILRLPATGTYYYRVQEFSTWMPDMVMTGPQGGPAFTYETGVIEMRNEQPRIVIDAEPGNDAASAVPLEFVMAATFVMGRFDSATDVDVFSFTSTSLPTRPEPLYIAVMPAGPMGYGATRTAGRVWITEDAGSTIVARGTVGEDVIVISPGLGSGPHHLWVEAPSGAAGTNDHYVIKAIFGTTENSPEEEETTNGALATAEAITMNAIEGGTGENGFVLAHLGTADVDYFSFDVMAGRTVSVACGSRTAGSGVIGLTAELRDSTDAVLATATETDAMNAFIDSFAVSGAGTYYLRITKTSQDPEVTGDWVRCGVTAAPPG